MAAWLIPVDAAISLGNLSFKLNSSFDVLGRRLVLYSADRSFLALIYGSAVFWFAATPFISTSRYFIPIGLSIIAFLVAALAVDPFLYAALFLEVVVLMAIPLFSPPENKPGKGLLRFLIFQTLAMPFILFSGWLLAGIEANPGDLHLVQQAAILIGLGFALLLAIFPFYSWIPLLTEETSPFSVGFFMWFYTTTALFFGLGFLDHYTWLRDMPVLTNVLSSVGLLMVLSAGVLAAFQNHLGRIMGYAIIMESGFSLLAITITGARGLDLFLLLLVPRVISILLWSLSLAVLKDHLPSLDIKQASGMGRDWPFVMGGLVLANLSIAGFPLLAGFPAHQAIWQALAASSINLVFWLLIGNLGLFYASCRALSTFVAAPEERRWTSLETGIQRILLAMGFLGLILIGLFPQWVFPLWYNLPSIFSQIGK